LVGIVAEFTSSRSAKSLSRKRCLTLEMIRKLDRELKIPVDKRRPTLPTLTLFCHSGKIKIRAKFLTLDRASI